jgi:hypothetical protein
LCLRGRAPVARDTIQAFSGEPPDNLLGHDGGEREHVVLREQVAEIVVARRP